MKIVSLYFFGLSNPTLIEGVLEFGLRHRKDFSPKKTAFKRSRKHKCLFSYPQ
ncbi:unnamed protein product [Acidithrix sp. C25]|nr:unnamed protein product [Acidithrix sp. C25]